MAQNCDDLKSKWENLKQKLEEALGGIRNNKRSWIFKNTPEYFELDHDEIELKSWTRSLLEVCHMYF